MKTRHVARRPALPWMLAWALLAGAPAQAGPALDRIRASGRLVVAWQPGPPFAYAVGDDRAPVGYAIDLCKRLAEAVRKSLDLKALRVDYLPVASAERIPTIVSGKADMECGSTTNNESRRRAVAFTIPHYITGTRYAVRADSGIEVLRDFDGKRLVSTTGSTPLASITRANREELLGIHVLEVRTVDEAMAMLERGDADGFAMDDVLLYALIADREDPRKFKVVGKFLTVEPLAMILPRDDPELKRIVDAEMKRLIADREAYELYDRWFRRPIPPRGRSLDMPMNYLLRDFWKYPSDWVPN